MLGEPPEEDTSPVEAHVPAAHIPHDTSNTQVQHNTTGPRQVANDNIPLKEKKKSYAELVGQLQGAKPLLQTR